MYPSTFSLGCELSYLKQIVYPSTFSLGCGFAYLKQIHVVYQSTCFLGCGLAYLKQCTRTQIFSVVDSPIWKSVLEHKFSPLWTRQCETVYSNINSLIYGLAYLEQCAKHYMYVYFPRVLACVFETLRLLVLNSSYKINLRHVQSMFSNRNQNFYSRWFWNIRRPTVLSHLRPTFSNHLNGHLSWTSTN